MSTNKSGIKLKESHQPINRKLLSSTGVTDNLRSDEKKRQEGLSIGFKYV